MGDEEAGRRAAGPTATAAPTEGSASPPRAKSKCPRLVSDVCEGCGTVLSILTTPCARLVFCWTGCCDKLLPPWAFYLSTW